MSNLSALVSDVACCRSPGRQALNFSSVERKCTCLQNRHERIYMKYYMDSCVVRAPFIPFLSCYYSVLSKKVTGSGTQRGLICTRYYSSFGFDRYTPSSGGTKSEPACASTFVVSETSRFVLLANGCCWSLIPIIIDWVCSTRSRTRKYRSLLNEALIIARRALRVRDGLHSHSF